MTQPTDLIERLRGPIGALPPDIQIEAANAMEAQAREIAGLQAARMAYASEFPPDGEGEPDVGSIHQNIRAMKAEIEGLRKDAERYQFLRDTCWLDTPLEHVICLQLNAKWDRAIDEAIDADKKCQP